LISPSSVEKLVLVNIPVGFQIGRCKGVKNGCIQF
jgi:hypothetical protein